jgi:hypothetical protein
MKGGSKRSRYTKEYTEKIAESGGGGTTDSCKSIAFTIPLQKATSAAGLLRVGDELEIKLKKGELLAIDDSGVLCGNIISSKNPSLIECMDKGYEYKAVVSSKKGTAIKVDVQIA